MALKLDHMTRTILSLPSIVLLSLVVLGGCASVPMGDVEEDARLKTFPPPPEGTAGFYIFRDSNLGAALKKTVMIDGKPIGQSAPMSYFYTTVAPGEHYITTESEFGDNGLALAAVAGENYYIDQYIKFGVMVGGANVKLVDETKGQNGVLSCKLAANIYGYEPYSPGPADSTAPVSDRDPQHAITATPENDVTIVIPEEVVQAAESMMCAESLSFSHKDGDKEYWDMECEDGESLELLCIEGTCYVR